MTKAFAAFFSAFISIFSAIGRLANAADIMSSIAEDKASQLRDESTILRLQERNELLHAAGLKEMPSFDLNVPTPRNGVKDTTKSKTTPVSQ